MKKILSVFVGLVIVSAIAVAQSNFNGNDLNPATRTQADVADAVANTAILQDQSKLPDQDNRHGYLSVLVNVANDGGVGTVNVGPLIPAGTAVIDGWAHVVTAFTPTAGGTNLALTVVSAGDVKAAATSFATTGLKDLVASPFAVTSEDQLSFVFGSTATQGVALIHLDLIKVQ